MQGKIIRVDVSPAFILLCLSLLLASCFHENNHAPTANAGANVSAPVKSTVTLDASLSSDVDGDSMKYQWEISNKPVGSASQLSDASAVKPQLLLDLVGEYVIKLVVSDGDLSSKADFITISTFNDRPIAEIDEVSVKSGSYYLAGETISVRGSRSSDPENEILFYAWEISVKPPGSVASLTTATGTNPSFVADLPGHYIVHLVVSDGTNVSEPKMLIFEIEQPKRKTDTRPFADAGPDKPLYLVGTQIQLDGSKSYDVENDVLNYRWEMILKPQGSNASLTNSGSVSPQFSADVLGDYVIKLVVSDANGDSHLDTVIVTPHENPDLACGDCHDNINSKGKPASHPLTYDDCYQCHFAEKWLPAKGVVHFHSHSAQPSQCVICHDGVTASGKPVNHIVTEKDCNACHRLSNGTWVPAATKPTPPTFSHQGIYSGCTACHDNILQKGKPAGHMPVSDRCFACHTTSAWATQLHLEHTQVLGQCDQCHDGLKAKGKSVSHIATTEQCNKCHEKVTWIQATNTKTVVHPDISGPCVGCHVKPDEFAVNKHLPTSNVCEKCHNTQVWRPTVTVDHDEVLGECLDCHNNALGKARWKSQLHLNTTNDCGSCHSTTSFAPYLAFDHNVALGRCVVCHNNNQVLGKSIKHLNTTDNCEACHSTDRFDPVIMVDHNEKVGRCGSVGCHKEHQGAGHIPTTSLCEACHSSAGFLPVIVVDHNEVTGDCIVCHNNSVAVGKFYLHIATTDDCRFCHTTAKWLPPYTVSHGFMLGACSSCHVGPNAPASVKPISHIPAPDSCGDAGCHSAEQWRVLKPVDHNQQTANCVSCHNGQAATGQSGVHWPTTVMCQACHKISNWLPLKTLDHSQLIESCVDCHNGYRATGKPWDHILVKDECGACHSTLVFSPLTVFDHTANVGSCVKCHNGKTATGKSLAHLETTDVCEACHSYANFFPLSIDHNHVVKSCFTCHNGTEAVGKSANHIESDNECHNCHLTSPLAWTSIRMEIHFLFIKLPCTTCHIAPNQHQALGIVDQCQSCHIAASWAYPARALLQQ